MNYDKPSSRIRERRTPKDWWYGLSTTWENFFIALAVALVVIVGVVIYLLVGDIFLYIAGAIAVFLVLWGLVALARAL